MGFCHRTESDLFLLLLRCLNSSMILSQPGSVGRSLKLYYIPHCRQSQLLYPDVIYNGRRAQCTYFQQLQIGMYSCTSSLGLCTIHFIILLWMVVPGLRLDDYVHMYTFIFILRCLPSEYKSTFCAPPTFISVQTGDPYSLLISGTPLSHVLEGVN